MSKCKKLGCKNDTKKGHTHCGAHNKGKDAGTKTYTYTKSVCHTGNVLAHTVGDIHIFAGGSSRSGGWWRMMPYPDLAIGPSEIVSGKGASPLDERWQDAKSAQWFSEPLPVVISLDWPDFGLPKGIDGKTMPAQFWHDLVEDIHTKGIKRISTQCMGGHGRTGVSLSILIYLLTPEEERPWTSLAELLAHVHEVYCKEAVEGDSQARYIAEVCGIEEGDYKLHHARATGFGNNWGHLGGWSDSFAGGVAAKPSGKGSWCSECRKYRDPKTVESGVCDACYEKMVFNDKDEGAEDEVSFKCDTCDTEYDSDVGICDACTIGQVLPMDEEKGDEGLDLLF